MDEKNINETTDTPETIKEDVQKPVKEPQSKRSASILPLLFAAIIVAGCGYWFWKTEEAKKAALSRP